MTSSCVNGTKKAILYQQFTIEISNSHMGYLRKLLTTANNVLRNLKILIMD